MYVIVEWREAKSPAERRKLLKRRKANYFSRGSQLIEQEKQTNRAYISQIVKWREAKN
jgi:hypothetical protein